MSSTILFLFIVWYHIGTLFSLCSIIDLLTNSFIRDNFSLPYSKNVFFSSKITMLVSLCNDSKADKWRGLESKVWNCSCSLVNVSMHIAPSYKDDKQENTRHCAATLIVRAHCCIPKHWCLSTLWKWRWIAQNINYLL